MRKVVVNKRRTNHLFIQSTNQSINQSINQSPHPPFHIPPNRTIHPSIHPFAKAELLAVFKAGGSPRVLFDLCREAFSCRSCAGFSMGDEISGSLQTKTSSPTLKSESPADKCRLLTNIITAGCGRKRNGGKRGRTTGWKNE